MRRTAAPMVGGNGERHGVNTYCDSGSLLSVENSFFKKSM
jgi:hypothetical protein